MAAMIAFCLAISIVWCDDFSCEDGGTANQLSGHCSCVCHVPSLDIEIVAVCYTPSVEIVDGGTFAAVAAAPPRQIFRPPTVS